MRGNQDSLLEEMDLFFSQILEVDSERRIKVLRNHVVIDPNLLWANEAKTVVPRTLNERIALAIASWYLGEFGYTVREDLRESLISLSLEDKFLVELLLSSKAQMIEFLKNTSLWHTRDFFGNLLPLAETILLHLKFRYPSVKVHRPQRRRGYNDKGSRAVDPFWKSARAFWEDEEVQLQREKDLDTYQDTLQFALGWSS